MNRSARLAFRLSTTALAFALAIASSLTCLAGTLGTSHQSEFHACCVAMGHDCGSATTRLDRDCCAAMSPTFAGMISASPIIEPPAVNAVTAQIVADAVTAAHAPLHSERTIRSSPDIPTYLLVSVFRL